MGRYESLLRDRRPRQRARLGERRPATQGTGSLTEWTARPVGRLGRPLLAEIEAYLHFFAIARHEDADPGK
jgi:hypothetical protein